MADPERHADPSIHADAGEAGSSAVVIGYGHGVVRCALSTGHGVSTPLTLETAERLPAGAAAHAPGPPIWARTVSVGPLGAHGLVSEILRAQVAP